MKKKHVRARNNTFLAQLWSKNGVNMGKVKNLAIEGQEYPFDQI